MQNILFFPFLIFSFFTPSLSSSPLHYFHPWLCSTEEPSRPSPASRLRPSEDLREEVLFLIRRWCSLGGKAGEEFRRGLAGRIRRERRARSRMGMEMELMGQLPRWRKLRYCGKFRKNRCRFFLKTSRTFGKGLNGMALDSSCNTCGLSALYLRYLHVEWLWPHTMTVQRISEKLRLIKNRCNQRNCWMNLKVQMPMFLKGIRLKLLLL